MTTKPSNEGPWLVQFRLWSKYGDKPKGKRIPTPVWAGVCLLITEREELWTITKSTNVFDVALQTWLTAPDNTLARWTTQMSHHWNWCDPVAFMLMHGGGCGDYTGETKAPSDHYPGKLPYAPAIKDAGTRIALTVHDRLQMESL